MSHIFDGDDALFGKGFQQQNIVVGKWFCFPFIHRNVPDHLALAQQGQRQKCAYAFLVDDVPADRIAVTIKIRVLEVRKVDDLLGVKDFNRGQTGIEGPNSLVNGQVLQLIPPMGDQFHMRPVLIHDVQACHRRLAQMGGPAQDSVKDRPVVVPALADDGEDFARGALAFQPGL